MILSATSVSFNYGYDNNVSYNGGVVYTLDGLDYTSTGLLASAIDVTLNKDQILVLTESVKLSESLTNNLLVPQPESYVYSTLIKDYAGRYLYATDPVNTQGSILSLTTALASATVFNFYFPPTPSTVQIYYTVPYQTTTQNLYLICNGSVNTVSGGQINGVPSVNYTYYYMLSGAAFSLVSTLPAINTQWLVSNGNNSLSFAGISGISSNTLVLPVSSIFCATNLSNNNEHGSVQDVGQSDLIKYQNVNNALVIDKTSNNVPFNYLISSAYKNLTVGNSVIDANINTLKNYYSPMHGQTAVLSASLRDYTKLYTGLNENTGTDKIYLGYNSNTSKLTFTKDKDVYFHYPYGTDILPLSSTTLIDYGSRADISPFRADKIFKKSATNSTYTSWGTTTNNPQNGVFFCSWLSAANYGDNNILKPVWVDRYYNPAVVNLLGINSNAIISLSGLLVGGINNYPNLVWDVPSSLTFEPGALYYYHRVGEQDNQTIVNSLTGLVYHIENWNINLVNSVNSLTAGSIVEFQPANNVTDNTLKTSYYNTEGTYGYINTINSDFTNNSGFTMSFYAYQSDWTNIQGDQIVGNYFNGGVGLFGVNKILTPYFTVAARIDSNVGVVSSTLQTYNTDLVLLNTEPFNYTNYIFAPGFGGTSWQTLSSAWATPSFILKTTYDKQQYVIDNYAYGSYLTTLDSSDLITNKVSLSSNMYSSSVILTGGLIVDAYIIPNSNGNVVTKTHPTNNSVTYRKFNLNGSLLYSYTNTDYNNFTVDLYGNTVWYNTNIPTPLNPATQASPISGYDMWGGTNATVDNNNNVFSLSGNGIQGTIANSWVIAKNGKPGISVVKPDYINCDQDNNIWVTYNNNYILKIDSNGNIIWSKQINTNNPIVTPYSTRVINFIAENTSNGVVYYGLIIDGRSQYIYKLDMNGNVVNSLYVPGLIPGGDSTGFDYQRKYVAPYVTTPAVQAKFVVQDSTLPTPTPNYITLTYSTSALAAGWHHFGLTFSQANVAGLFVDGKLVTEIPTSTDTTFTDQFGNPLVSNTGDNIVGLNSPYALYSIYNYKNNPQIAIGASNFKTGTLNTWIKKPDTYLFNGGIADLRVYNIALNSSDLKAITKNYLINQFIDLTWNVPTSTRGYIEEIERFFLHRLPGSKSQLYNIRIKNSGITDPSVQAIVEENIRAAALSTAPAHTQLRSIIWE